MTLTTSPDTTTDLRELHGGWVLQDAWQRGARAKCLGCGFVTNSVPYSREWDRSAESYASGAQPVPGITVDEMKAHDGPRRPWRCQK